jgi:phospholipase/lecithinase/hemolysin
MKNLRTRLSALTAAVLVAACGGGGSDTTPRVKITSVRVFGDSLEDVGTFRVNALGNLVANGQPFKFTVQGANSFTYPELLAQAYGVAALCPFFVFTGSTFTANSAQTGCTGFAIGGSVINSIDPTVPAISPQRISTQLATAAATGGFSATDLLMIDGGGNDAADLIGAFTSFESELTAAAGDVTKTTYFLLASSVLGATATGATLTQPNGSLLLGGQYMTALADTFYASIKASALDHGATNVVILNVPGITRTPRFGEVLAQITALKGAAVSAALAGAFDGWIQAFNAELSAKVAGDARVVLVDGYTTFNQEIADPAQFALSNVITPACRSTGTDPVTHLKDYTFPTCTDAALSAITPPPDGASGGANWWKNYLFSDSFHPTPYGHQLVYQRISLDLAKTGRL